MNEAKFWGYLGSVAIAILGITGLVSSCNDDPLMEVRSVDSVPAYAPDELSPQDVAAIRNGRTSYYSVVEDPDAQTDHPNCGRWTEELVITADLKAYSFIGSFPTRTTRSVDTLAFLADANESADGKARFYAIPDALGTGSCLFMDLEMSAADIIALGL